jgi:hypothetical protein
VRRILATTKSELKTLIGKVAVRGRADTNPSRALSGGRRSPMVLGDRRELEGHRLGIVPELIMSGCQSGKPDEQASAGVEAGIV